jgi:hypothetical protein
MCRKELLDGAERGWRVEVEEEEEEEGREVTVGGGEE